MIKNWIPGMHLVEEGKNPSRVHSAWIGVSSVIVYLPLALWRSVLSEIVYGVWWSVRGLLDLGKMILAVVAAGFRGQLIAVPREGVQ